MRTRKGLVLHLILLAVSAVIAWWAFGTDVGGPASDQIFVDLSAGDISRIRLIAEQRTVDVDALKDASGHFVRIEEKISKRQSIGPKKADGADGGTPDGASPDGGTPDGAAPDAVAPVATETRHSRYRASAEFGKALDRLFPLTAVRELGHVAEADLARYGLDAPKTRLILTTAGEEWAFAIGKKTYGGSSCYLRRLPDGPTALVSAGLLRTLDFKPPRYKELRFFGLPAKDVERIKLACPGLGERSLLRKPGRKPGTVMWVPEDDPTRDDVLFSNWVAKLLRLTVGDYAAAGDQPKMPTRCQLTVQPSSGDPVQAVLAWAAAPDGKTAYAGKSDFSTVWVDLEPSAAAAVQADLPAILGAEASAKP